MSDMPVNFERTIASTRLLLLEALNLINTGETTLGLQRLVEAEQLLKVIQDPMGRVDTLIATLANKVKQ